MNKTKKTIFHFIFIPIMLFLFINNIYCQNILCIKKDTSHCFQNILFNNTTIQIEKKFESNFNTRPYFIPLVADINNDCIPEILIESFNTDSLNCINSKNGELKTRFRKHLSDHSITSYVILDIDGDYIPEIISHTGKSGLMYPPPESDKLICYKLDGSILWVSDSTVNLYSFSTVNGVIGVADFNQDGIPEVYISNKIFNARTGVKLCDGGGNGKGHSNSNFRYPISISANLDQDDSNLELAAGYTIYKVIINNLNGMAGNQMIPYNVSVNGRLEDGPTSVADINLDGKLDVIVSVSGDNNTALLYVYHFEQNTSRLLAYVRPPTPLSGNSGRPISAPSVGNINLTGRPSILISRPNYLLSYRYIGTGNLRMDWDLITTDTSGGVGITLFDFNADGINEIIYRDMTHIKVIDGSTNNPFVISQADCISPTYIEFPTVADIDNTGGAKTESEQLGFFGAVRKQYLERAAAYPDRFFVIDSTASPEAIRSQLTSLMSRWNG